MKTIDTYIQENTRKEKWFEKHSFIMLVHNGWWKLYFIVVGAVKLHWVREIKWFFQRGIRGYDDTYAWGIDDSLGPVIIDVLKQFRDIDKTTISFPVYVNGKDGDIDDEKSIANEKRILTEMIEGFETLVGHDDILYDMYITKYPNRSKDANKEYNKIMKDAEKKAKMFITHFNNLWD